MLMMTATPHTHTRSVRIERKRSKSLIILSFETKKNRIQLTPFPFQVLLLLLLLPSFPSVVVDRILASAAEGCESSRRRQLNPFQQTRSFSEGGTDLPLLMVLLVLMVM